MPAQRGADQGGASADAVGPQPADLGCRAAPLPGRLQVGGASAAGAGPPADRRDLAQATVGDVLRTLVDRRVEPAPVDTVQQPVEALEHQNVVLIAAGRDWYSGSHTPHGNAAANAESCE